MYNMTPILEIGKTIILFWWLGLIFQDDKSFRNQYHCGIILDFNWENVISQFKAILKYREN